MSIMNTVNPGSSGTKYRSFANLDEPEFTVPELSNFLTDTMENCKYNKLLLNCLLNHFEFVLS